MVGNTQVAATALAVVFLSVSAAQAADPAAKCEMSKLKETGKYGLCRLKADAKGVQRGDLPDYERCATKFSLNWRKAEAKAGSGTCTSERDEASIDSLITANTARSAKLLTGLRYENTGLGTVIDHKTGLEWQKTDDGDGSTDKDRLWSWTNSEDLDYTNPDGTAFTEFLDGLNACESSDGETLTGGYGGHCDWRMPTIVELVTIRDCSFGDLCIDQSVFGPIATNTGYWTSVTYYDDPTWVWFVNFSSVGPMLNVDEKDLGGEVRAVRSVP